MEDKAVQSPASVLLDWSTLTGDVELEFKSGLSVDELEFDVSEVVCHCDVLGKDLDAVHDGCEGVVVPVASTNKTESDSNSSMLSKSCEGSAKDIVCTNVE